jgi:hypothetical protein
MNIDDMENKPTKMVGDARFKFSDMEKNSGGRPLHSGVFGVA